MNNVEKVIIDCLVDITGLDEDSLIDAKKLNVFENGILDSLSLVNLMSELEEKLNIEIDFSKLKQEDFSSIESIINAIEKML